MSAAAKKKKNRLQMGGGAKAPAKKDKGEGEGAPKATSGQWTEHKVDTTELEKHKATLKYIPGAEGLQANGLPEGFMMIPDFITEEEEDRLYKYFDAKPWDEVPELRRRTQQWGFKFDYSAMTVVERTEELPEEIDFLVNRMLSVPTDGVKGTYPYPKRPTQMIVNEYSPGTGIHSHVDRSCFDDCVASLGMGSCCTFVLDKVEASNTVAKDDLATMPSFAKAAIGTSSSAIHVFFPRRALVMMKGDARYKWTHGIPASTWDEDGRGRRHQRDRRISLTFRIMTEKGERRADEGPLNFADKGWSKA